MRPYLVEVENDLIMGYRAPMHDEVIAQGGRWEMLAYWNEAPISLPVLGKDYNAIVLVDVPNHGLISTGYSLPMDFADKTAFMTYINSTPASTLPAPIRNKLSQSGFTVSGTIAEMLQDIM